MRAPSVAFALSLAVPAVAACASARTTAPLSSPAADVGSEPPATPSAGESAPARARRAEPRSLVLAFGGDVIAHEAVRDAGARVGYDALLGAARAALGDADLAFVNLESPVTPRWVRRGQKIFRADEEMLAALAGAGVKLVSLANNHAFDQGPEGLADSMAAVERHGLVGIGAGRTLADACAPVFLEQKGIRVAMLARTLVMNFHDGGARGKPDVCMLAEGPLKRAARAARASGADLVVASLHWGNEYERAPRREQIDAARRVVESGVDLLIGHHPHVLQPVVRMKTSRGTEAVVAYSLGNLLSNQGYGYRPGVRPEREGDTRDAAVLRIEVSKGADGAVRVDAVRAVPLWTEHRPDGAIVLVPATTRRARIARALQVPLEEHAPDCGQERCAEVAGR